MGHPVDHAITDPAEFWETRYNTNRGESGHMWSGRVNAAVEHEVTALNLGCGEGADALRLAAHGWTVTPIDISDTALVVGAAQATRAGLAERINWVQADLATWNPPSEFDPVTRAFVDSPVELPRQEVLRRVASAVAPGGRLLVVGHGAFPPGSSHGESDAPPLPTSDEVLASLELPDPWVIETKALFYRSGTGADGTTIILSDTELRIRREHRNSL